MKWAKLIMGFLLTLLAQVTTAQSEIEMADEFRGEGKIYVVVVVILIILSGIFWTLFRLDRKVNELEKEKEEEQ